RSTRRAVLLVSGLHPSGIDEPRLVRFSRNLSADNVLVVTPAIPELTRFLISPSITDDIEQAAAWLASQPSIAPDGRIGLIGISFSGGLGMVAAGPPSLEGGPADGFSLVRPHASSPVLRHLAYA